MTRYSRRTLLKTGAAFAGASALAFPAIVRAQATKIKIGHLTPLTGFLGAIGSYAQLGVKLAAEEINQAGGIMGKQIDLMSEDSVNPATASTKAQRMIEQDGAVVLLGEISSASSLTGPSPARLPSRCSRSCSRQARVLRRLSRKED